MKKVRSKLNWFLRFWYSKILFFGQYVSFKDSGEEEFFWNIVSWYHYFSHNKEFRCKICWYISDTSSAYLHIYSNKDNSSETVLFESPIPVIQVTKNLDCYRQVDGAIYKIEFQ